MQLRFEANTKNLSCMLKMAEVDVIGRANPKDRWPEPSARH
jgi:hypothetical protein